MVVRPGRSQLLGVGAAVLLAFGAGCDSRQGADPNGASARPTQGAVSSAVQRVSETVAQALDPHVGTETANQGASRQVPELHVQGAGTAARVTVTPNEHHESPSTVRTPDGWAVVWGDRDHSHAMFARTDAAGQPVGEPVVVREARSDEEDIWSPAVAFTGHEFGMAWTDPANGRVVFARLDAQGQPVGRLAVIHEGLEMPRMTRVVWNGSEFGVAVGMHQGVYFARVSARGERIGEGVMVAEGSTVASLDNLEPVAGGYQLSWRDADNEGAQHQVRVSRNGQVSALTSGATGSQYASR